MLFAVVVSEWGQLARIKLVPDELRRQTARVTAERNSLWWEAPENGAKQLFCPKWLINVDKKWGIIVRALCIVPQKEKTERRGHLHQGRCHWGGEWLPQSCKLFLFHTECPSAVEVSLKWEAHIIWHTVLQKMVKVQRHWHKTEERIEENVIGKTACDKLSNF